MNLTFRPHDLALRDARATADIRLTDEETTEQLGHLAGWQIKDGALYRELKFADFHATMAFVNAVAWIAHQADHHPDLEVGYNRCSLRWSTHSAGGLTLKDMICAARVDALQCRQA